MTTYSCEPRRRILRSSSTVSTGLPLSGDPGESSFWMSSEGCGTRKEGLLEPGSWMGGIMPPSPGDLCSCAAGAAPACTSPGANTS